MADLEALKILGLITARGNSKGIPKKNIAPAAGRPLIAWTIEAARWARSIDRVVVSTDDPEIAAVSRQWGAEVPFSRPDELARDDSPHIPVVIHAVEWLMKEEGYHPDYVMLLQPTSPLRESQDIDAAVALAVEKGADAVVSGFEAPAHPYIIKRIDAQGRLADYVDCPEGYLPRQALPPAYALNGAVFLVRRQVLLDEQTLYPANTLAYIMPPERSLDVDTPWDLHLADLILRDKYGPQNN